MINVHIPIIINIKTANNKWFMFNDTSVKEINIEKTLNKNYAYCLFYRKKVEV